MTLATEAHGQALAEGAKAYFARKGGRKGAWVDVAAEAATVTVFDTAIALMARGCWPSLPPSARDRG